MQEIVLGALLVLVIIGLIAKIRKSKTEAAPAKPPGSIRDTSSFHAVAIKYSENACDAAKAMTGRRFLSNAAPRLPLPECNLLECRCMFAHYDDRRTGRDRRSPFAPAGTSETSGAYKAERRGSPERRRADDDDDFEW